MNHWLDKPGAFRWGHWGRSISRIFACLAVLGGLLSACAAPTQIQQTLPGRQTAPETGGKPTRTPFPTRRAPLGTREPTIDASAQPTGEITQAAGTETGGTPATPGEAPVTITFGGALNVRRGPGLAYDTVAAFDTGQSAEAQGRDANGEWLQVEVPNSTGVFGWVYSKAPTVNVSGDPLSLPEATFTDAVPAYVRNCTSHQIALRPGELILEPLAQQPANRQQVNPGFYEVVDLTLNAASVTTMSVTEGSELIVTQDGNGVNYTCPR